MKTPRIRVQLQGVGAKLVVECLRRMYEKVEVINDDDAVDVTSTAWWKKMQAASHAGTVLWTYRDNAGLTLDQLADVSGIAKSHLSDMENGKRIIGPKTARKLAAALSVDHRMFL